MDFFIWNIKFFFNFPGLTRVDPWNPEPGPLAGSTPGPGLIIMYITYRIIGYLVDAIYNTLVPKERSVMAKGLRSAQQVSSSSQGVHLL
jgi:hypothetical protein